MDSRGPTSAAAGRSRRSLFRELSSLRVDGILGQGVRFALSGVVVAIVYVTVTTVLSAVSHLHFEVALAIAWCTAVSLHFTLQRVFVWAHQDEFALPFGRQVGRYLLVAGSQLGITAAATAVLPSVLGVPAELIYLVTVLILASVNFLVLRNGIFHPGASDASGT